MPAPRFRHNFEHDVFLSYTHIDDQLDGGRNWVSQFRSDLKTRLEIVSGHTVDIWYDKSKLDASDRFDSTIAEAVRKSAVMVPVLSPTYFNSEYCGQERSLFLELERDRGPVLANKARLVKVVKFFVSLQNYPPELLELLEHCFYVQVDGRPDYKEFHLSEDPKMQSRYSTKVDDVAQEIARLLSAMEPEHVPVQPKVVVYLAETTSDLDSQRDDLRRFLVQAGCKVLPDQPLRFLPDSQLREHVAVAMNQCQVLLHMVGGYFGQVPESGLGKSIVQIQMEVASELARSADRARIIFIPEGVKARETLQESFLETVRSTCADQGFELLEGAFRSLASRLQFHLENRSTERQAQRQNAGIYLMCDNADRAAAKAVKAFLFNQKLDVEWTPIAAASGELIGHPDHQKLLQRNRAHLVFHGSSSESWLQDRVHELASLYADRGDRDRLGAIYLADPKRDDKEDIMTRDATLLTAYAPKTIADAVAPFLQTLGVSGASA